MDDMDDDTHDHDSISTPDVSDGEDDQQLQQNEEGEEEADRIFALHDELSAYWGQQAETPPAAS